MFGFVWSLRISFMELGMRVNQIELTNFRSFESTGVIELGDVNVRFTGFCMSVQLILLNIKI